MFGIKIIVKTIGDSRSNTKLRAGKQFLYRLSQNVRGGVTKNFQSILTIQGHDFNFGILI
ncbi:hypothetical protein SDC9_205659 [bioreactor metagenome]|uniref:Uncharacterized protein n=1 Tax=bioreactor metagenome TaxID=1076179 RepID=A0A645JEG3_9ZZZZ